VRTLPDGTVMRRITGIAVPTLRLVPNPFARDARQFDRVEALTWTLPIDDTHFRLYSAGRVTVPGSFKPRVEGVDLLANYNWHVMTPAERQARHSTPATTCSATGRHRGAGLKLHDLGR
jgi:hypothetical protein